MRVHWASEAGASTKSGGDGSSDRVGTGLFLGAAADDDGRKLAYRGRKWSSSRGLLEALDIGVIGNEILNVEIPHQTNRM